jgi:hypothetical protein
MRGARVGAGVLAALALGIYGVLLIVGSSLGWVVEVGGGAGGESELLDARGELPWLTVLLLSALVGSVLAVKRPRNPIPWLLAVGAIGYLAYPPVVVAVGRALAADPVPTWAPYVAWIGNWVWVVGQAGMTYLLLLFPDGRPLSGRWRIVLRVGAVYLAGMLVLLALWPELEAAPGLANPFGVEALGRVESALTPLMVGFVLLQGFAIVCVVLRFVRSAGVERQQMKWMALGAASLAATLTAVALGAPRWLQAVSATVLVAAIVIAVTRYRLYEIDRVINRTVSYALLTLVLAGVYVSGVVGLGALVRTVTGGGGGSLVVAASTLAAAAVFGPARRRVQAFVDRRFDRARYDALRALEALRARLRDEVDLDELHRSLVATVAETVAPVGVDLWLSRAGE